MNYLFISNTSKPSKKEYESLQSITLNNYSIPCVEAAFKLGCKVYMGISRRYAEHVKCTNYPAVQFYNAQIYRNPLNVCQVYNAYKSLISIIRKKNINIIHCNTPIGGALGRFCKQHSNIKTVIYTAHGLHFYKGCNFLQYCIFYMIEKFLTKFTDVIITINDEDFLAMSKMTKRNKHIKVYKVNGVGIDTSLLEATNVDNSCIRRSLGFSENDFLIITVGDLNSNKNQEVIIKALGILGIANIHLIICGIGKKRTYLEKLCKKYHIEKQVHFLGLRNDIPDLLKISNLFILASKREGLPRSVMEAMAVGLPCIVSNIRGNKDLIDNLSGGILCTSYDHYEFADAIKVLYSNESLRNQYGKYNQTKVKNFDVKIVKKQISKIYDSLP